MAINLLNKPLFQAADWLEKNKNARMRSTAKLAHLLVTFGGTYRTGEPEKLRIAGVEVSCTGGTANLLSAWQAKAEAKLNAGEPGAR